MPNIFRQSGAQDLQKKIEWFICEESLLIAEERIYEYVNCHNCACAYNHAYCLHFSAKAELSDVIRAGRMGGILLKTSATMTHKVAVQEKYTSHKFYASRMSIFRKCFVWIFILEKLKIVSKA